MGVRHGPCCTALDHHGPMRSDHATWCRARLTKSCAKKNIPNQHLPNVPSNSFTNLNPQVLCREDTVERSPLPLGLKRGARPTPTPRPLAKWPACKVACLQVRPLSLPV